MDPIVGYICTYFAKNIIDSFSMCYLTHLSVLPFFSLEVLMLFSRNTGVYSRNMSISRNTTVFSRNNGVFFQDLDYLFHVFV
jgi:hypothetical protein